MTLLHGALQAFLAVLAGAFGAHGLQNILDEYGLKIWQTGVTYHLAHALALVLLGIFERQARAKFRIPHYAFGIGILLFSGSLYALALTGNRALGMITPLGGTAFLIGWLALAWSAWKSA
jgi:uncharacterized membrane protein YgdD (TMEM256/DUF423 family)